MSLRVALAALDDAALEAASSKGLVRRAHRDREAGLAHLTHETAEAIALTVDGEAVSLRPGGLAAATCSCPSQALCRHVLAAIIALRTAPPDVGPQASAGVANDEGASPACGGLRETSPGAALDADPLAELAAFAPADLVAAFGRPALRDAEALLLAAADGPDALAIEIVGRTCLVRLAGQPEVRYLAGLGLAGMIAKEPAPILVMGTSGKPRRKALSAAALRAAAVLASRRQHAGTSAPDRASRVPFATDDAAKPDTAKPDTAKPDTVTPDTAFLDAVTAALAESARAGLATAPLLLEERLLDLALSSRADALPRLAGALRGIAEDLSERRARAATFEPAAALIAIARTYALVLALRRDGDDPILRGSARQPYADLGTLDLVGCGLALWRTPTGARGATAYALVLGAGTRGWVSLSLARAAGQDPLFVPIQAVRTEPVFGRSLETLAAARFRLERARASADGRLSLGTETSMSARDGGLAGLLATRSDLFVEDWGTLESRLAAQFSPSLRSTVRALPLALRPAAVEPVQFDAIEQRAWLPVMDRTGRWLELTIGGDADDTRLDAIVAMQASGVPQILVVIATRDGADIVLSPIAAHTGDAGSLRSFDLWERPRAVSPPRTVLDRLKDGVGSLMRRQRTTAVFRRDARNDATAGLIARAEDEVLALAELGGRMEDKSRLETFAQLAVELDGAGLAPLAALLSRLATSLPRERPLRLLAFVHASACHTALVPYLPFVERI